jgi:hypothetical protein
MAAIHQSLNGAGMRAIVSMAVLLACGLFCSSPAGISQNNSPAGVNQGGAPYLHSQAGLNPTPQQGVSESASQIDQMRAAERHKRILADTAKLAQLSSELKAQVDQTPNDQLSLDMVKKAAEIEKVARDLNGWLKE